MKSMKKKMLPVEKKGRERNGKKDRWWEGNERE